LYKFEFCWDININLFVCNKNHCTDVHFIELRTGINIPQYEMKEEQNKKHFPDCMLIDKHDGYVRRKKKLTTAQFPYFGNYSACPTFN
jgi:hypothetical protein